MSDLDQFIARAKHLPPAPMLLPELLELLSKPDVDVGRMVRVITFDPALTANVLRLCNSASSGSASPVVNLDEAVARVGFNEIYRLVAATCGSRSFQIAGNTRSATQVQLWTHSVAAAVGAQFVASDLELDRNLAFTAALLHDLGKILLYDVLDERYALLIAEVEQQQYSLVDTEARVLGLQHAALGARLLARWKFPLSLVAPVCFHHTPAAAGTHQRLAACVALGNFIAYTLGHGSGDPALVAQGSREILGILGLQADRLPEYVEAIRAELTSVQKLVQLGA